MAASTASTSARLHSERRKVFPTPPPHTYSPALPSTLCSGCVCVSGAYIVYKPCARADSGKCNRSDRGDHLAEVLGPGQSRVDRKVRSCASRVLSLSHPPASRGDVARNE